MKAIKVIALSAAVLVGTISFAQQRTLKKHALVAEASTKAEALAGVQTMANELLSGNARVAGWSYYHSCPRSGEINFMGARVYEKFSFDGAELSPYWVASLTFTNSKCFTGSNSEN